MFTIIMDFLGTQAEQLQEARKKKKEGRARKKTVQKCKHWVKSTRVLNPKNYGIFATRFLCDFSLKAKVRVIHLAKEKEEERVEIYGQYLEWKWHLKWINKISFT